MPITGTPEPVTTRLLEEYTIGGGRQKPDVSATVSLSSSSQSLPPFMTIIGATAKVMPSPSFGSMSVGQVVTLTQYVGLTEFPSYTVETGRELRFLATASAQHGITGLVLQSLQVQGVVNVASVQLIGQKFAGGQTYTAYSVQIICAMYAAAANSGGTVNFYVTAALYDAPAST